MEENHQIMPNGNGLLGSVSSTQASLIVPQPLSYRYYYVFTVGAWYPCAGGNLTNGCQYSVVDICADSLRGDVVPALKNIQLLDMATEKVAVSKHSNDIDYWILTHKFGSNGFYAFHLTPNGITDTVISAIGAFHTGDIGHSMGQLKFSSDGQKIAIGIAHPGFGTNDSLEILEVFDFNSSTGSVSNVLSLRIPNDNFSVYGVEFSNDGSKLYITGAPVSGMIEYFIYQYDLSAGGGNKDSINTSRNLIAKPPLGIVGFRGLQIGPDNKIYLVSYSNNTSLSVINNPNIFGVGCNYQNEQVSLAGNNGSYSLPSFIAGYNYSNTIANCNIASFTGEVQSVSPRIYPNPFSNQLTFALVGNKQTTVSLYNFIGQQVLQQTLTSTTTINTVQLADGIYFYELRDNKGVIRTGKVVKQ